MALNVTVVGDPDENADVPTPKNTAQARTRTRNKIISSTLLV